MQRSHLNQRESLSFQVCQGICRVYWQGISGVFRKGHSTIYGTRCSSDEDFAAGKPRGTPRRCFLEDVQELLWFYSQFNFCPLVMNGANLQPPWDQGFNPWPQQWAHLKDHLSKDKYICSPRLIPLGLHRGKLL